MSPFKKLSTIELTTLLGEDFLEQLEGVLELSAPDALDELLLMRRFLLSKIAAALYSHKFASVSAILKLARDADIHTVFSDYLSEGITPSDATSTEYSYETDASFLNFVAKKAGLSLSFEEIKNAQTKDADEVIGRPSRPFRPLKSYQLEVFNKTIQALEPRFAKFIIHMPTGSGKTRTAAEVICHFLNSNPTGTVIWIAHSVELCDQAYETLSETWQHLGTRDIRACRFYEGHADEVLSKKKHIDFLCASFQTLYAKLSRLDDLNTHLCGEDRLIIVDEAHKVIAPTYQKVTKKFFEKNYKLIGLTATPGRSFALQGNEEENEELSDFFNNEYLTFNCGEEGPIQHLQERSILAKAKMSTMTIDAQVELNHKELKFVAENFDIPESVLKRIGKNKIRNAEILTRLKNLLDEGRKSIIYFATSIEQSKLICALLHLAGIKAAHVDGTCQAPYRKFVINQFRSGEIKVLCNFQVLTTGFDAPKIDCVFIARPTSSVVLYSQMIGRGLRGPKLGGLPTCDVVTVKDNFENLPEANNIFNIFQEYWS